MIVKKAGCILIDLKNKKIGLVYRKKQNDYSFPKGHLDYNETLEECAVRETEEETGRKCEIVCSTKLPTLSYVDSLGDKSIVYYYLAIDLEQSSKIFDDELVHQLVWVPFQNVESTLSYQILKDFWNQIKVMVNDTLDNENI